MTTQEEALQVTWGEERPCADPECEGSAEVEQDGEHRYWQCVLCGFEFGWERVPAPGAVGGGESCSMGIPVATRAAVSSRAPVDLGMIGRRVE